MRGCFPPNHALLNSLYIFLKNIDASTVAGREESSADMPLGVFPAGAYGQIRLECVT